MIKYRSGQENKSDWIMLSSNTNSMIRVNPGSIKLSVIISLLMPEFFYCNLSRAVKTNFLGAV